MNLITLFFANFKPAAFLTLMLAVVFSCNPKPSGNPERGKALKNYSIAAPDVDNIYSLSDTVHFEIVPRKNSLSPDSVHILSNGNLASSQYVTKFGIPGNLLASKFGIQNLRIKIYFSDSLSQILTTRIIVLPDEPPKQLKYQIVEQLPHNRESSTQGLVLYKDNLYEGTGQLGKSKLMKIDPKSGQSLLERNLESDFFGEGITILGKNIYQLTYQSMLGFVYDLESFEQIREFELQTEEGWGLATDGKSLIVSDGSHTLYFYEPLYFSQTNQIEVCNNLGLISFLNELEYVNGDIWANVYGKKHILQIDAQSGKVKGILDLSGIFPKNIPDDMEHVLNGIAYDSVTDNFYVTGKLWPVLYKIKIED